MVIALEAAHKRQMQACNILAHGTKNVKEADGVRKQVASAGESCVSSRAAGLEHLRRCVDLSVVLQQQPHDRHVAVLGGQDEASPPFLTQRMWDQE
jgi:hypothetical protein